MFYKTILGGQNPGTAVVKKIPLLPECRSAFVQMVNFQTSVEVTGSDKNYNLLQSRIDYTHKKVYTADQQLILNPFLPRCCVVQDLS